MTRIILVRHGKSTYNQERRIQGRLDKSILTEAGRSTALQVGDTLSSIAFDAAYTSPPCNEPKKQRKSSCRA